MFYKLFNSIDLFQSEKRKKRAFERGVCDIIIGKGWASPSFMI